MIGDERLQFSYLLEVEDDKDGDIFIRNRSIIDKYLDETHYKLWDNQSELHGYVNTSLLDFKPIDELFKIND